jgi:HK97 family phage major capsid protein
MANALRKPEGISFDQARLEDRLNNHHKSFAGFMSAVMLAKSSRPEVSRIGTAVLKRHYDSSFESSSATVTKTVMGENTGLLGGYIVPLEYSTKILKSIVENSFIWPRATIIPMNSKELLAPKVDVETAPGTAGTSALVGGILYTWGSSQAPSETEPTFRQLSLNAWDLLGYAKVSNQFLTDIGPEGEQCLVDLFAKAGAWYAEYAFLNGTGTSLLMPLGILNAPGTLLVNRTTSSQIVTADIANMGGALLTSSWNTAIWLCSPTAKTFITKMTGYTVNRPTTDDFAGSAGCLDGRPLFVTEKLPALGTTGDLILIDPSLYTIGNRQEILVDVSGEEPSTFPYYQSMFRMWLRLDGKPQVSKTITLQDNSTVVSPYVVLH